jgi:hypothetical protein
MEYPRHGLEICLEESTKKWGTINKESIKWEINDLPLVLISLTMDHQLTSRMQETEINQRKVGVQEQEGI